MSPEIIIERVSAAQNLPARAPTQNLPALKQGESLLAQVLSTKGTNVTFKTAQGRVFTASMLAGFALAAGENVELFVKENSTGKILMQLISVEPASSGAKKDILSAMGLKENPQAREAAALLEKLNIKPTQSNMQSVMNSLKEHPALNVKAAVFFAANQIPATNANVQNLQKLVSKGNGIGENLMALAGQAQSSLAEGEPAILGNAQAKDGQAASNNTLSKEAPVPTGGKAQPLDTTETKQPAVSLEDNTAKAPQTKAKGTSIYIKEESGAPGAEGLSRNPQPMEKTYQPPQPMANHTETAAKIPDDLSSLPEKGTAITPQASALPPSDAPAKEAKPEELLLRLLSLFVPLEEGDAKGLKKAAEENPKELKALQELAGQTDMKHKEMFTAKLQDIVSQDKLVADVNRFACFYIPVTIGEQAQTAELYIYKNNKRGKKIDKENTVIGIGIDTPHLGRVEARLQIEKKNVSLAMKLENEAALPLAKEQSGSLSKSLNELGYRLTDTKISKLTERTTIIDAEEEWIKPVGKTPVFIDYKV